MAGNPLKRKRESSQEKELLDERAWNIMRKMGYEQGRGLGANAQGIVEPLAVSKHKGRRGFGLEITSDASTDRSDVTLHPPDPNFVWHKDHNLDSISDDRVWRWSKFDSPHLGSVSEDTGKTVEVRSILLAPENEQAIGPPIRHIEEENLFCSAHLIRELSAYKNQLDNILNANVKESHQRSNPYELLKNGIFMNRAAMKLANMDALFNGIFTNAVSKNTILYFADVCAGPGGFSEYLLWRRCNAAPLPPAASELPVNKGLAIPRETDQSSFGLNVKGYGLTLTGSCNFRTSDFFAGPSEAFMPHYGPKNDGDITKWANLASFSSLVGRDTKGKGVHVVVADGGFDVSGKYNLQEVLSKRLYLCQSLCALTLLRPGGHFLTKFFDTFTEFTVELIYLLGQVFEEIYIIKPLTSRPANSERYLLCKNLLSPAPGMAGCPAAPKCVPTGDSAPGENSNTSCFKQRPRKQALRRLLHQPTVNGEKDFSPLDRNETGPVGDLIDHFLRVNEALGRDQSSNSAAEFLNPASRVDVLRMCVPKTVSGSESFMRFIVKTNQEFAETQCVALSKLLAFASNQELKEERQLDYQQLCLNKWKLSSIERKRVPWPLVPANYSEVVHSLLGDGEKPRSLNALPDDHLPNKRTTLCTPDDLAGIEHLMDTCIALVCASPSSTAPSQPILIYSRGSDSMGLHCTTDGNQWLPLEEVVPLLSPRLPAGTLIWGQSVYEYSPKNGCRRYALMIFDIACINGHDCRRLPYVKRIELAERVADVVNFPDMQASYVRVPPMTHLRNLHSFVSGLPLRSCKDAPSAIPMHVYEDGYVFQPHSLLLVKYLIEPWISVICESTGKIYYSNHITKETTFDLRTTRQPSFTTYSQTRFVQLLWHATQKDGICVSRLIDYIKPT